MVKALAPRLLRAAREPILVAFVLLWVGAMAYVPHSGLENRSDQSPRPPGELVLVFLGDHPNQTAYPFPLHADEYLHWAYAAQIEREGSVNIADPYTHVRTAGSVGLVEVHERGFQLVLAELHLLTGIHWLLWFQFLPAVWLAFTALGVYTLFRPAGIGLSAAFLVGLVPTTVRFLGPGFLVPITFAFPLLVAECLLLRRLRGAWRPWLLLAAIQVWLTFIHGIAALAGAFLLLSYALATVRGSPRTAVGVLLLSGVVSALFFQHFGDRLQDHMGLVERIPSDFSVFDHFGAVTLALFLMGAAWMPVRRWGSLDPMVVAWSMTAVAALACIVYSLAIGPQYILLYPRQHMIFFLTATVPAAFALREAGERLARAMSRLPRLGARFPRAVPRALQVAVVGAGLFLSAYSAVGYHTAEAYYHILDEESWDAIREVGRLNGTYEKVLVEPLLGPALAAETGKAVHAFAVPGIGFVNGADWVTYLDTERTDLFLVERDIDTVARGPFPRGEGFEPVTDDVFILRWPYAQALDRVR